MLRLASLSFALLLTLSAASATNLVIDPFTLAQPNDSSDPAFESGLGTSLRFLAPSTDGTVEITGSGLAVESTNGAPLLSYFFYSTVDLTDYTTLFLRGVTVTGSPEIYADLFDPTVLQSIALTPSGSDYVVDLSDFTDVDLTQVQAINFRFAETGSPMTFTANSLEATPAPEPSTVLLLSLGAATIFLLKRRRFSLLS